MNGEAAGWLEDRVHVFPLRVYYEDTDALGYVYYATYLNYVERARTELLRTLGIEQTRLRAETGAVFVVRRAEIDYRKPARLDDRLEVRSRLTRLAAAFIEAEQTVARAGEPLAEIRVTIACVGPGGKPVRLPSPVRDALSPLVQPS